MVPYIYEDYVSNETTAEALLKLHDMGPEKRAVLGEKARAYALTQFDIKQTVGDWHRTLSKTISDWHEDRNKIYQPWESVTL
jgi:hypothetical protein